jgi:hypothetical protein
MKETVQEYMQRMQNLTSGKNHVKVQEATAGKLERVLKGVTTAKLRKRPAPDKWSVAEIVTHLADAEIAYSWRIRAILGSPGTPIQGFDQDGWVEAMHYARRDPRQSLAQFRTLRDVNLALYKTLSPQQWKQFGMHSERGEESIERIVMLLAGHDLNHLAQIERILNPKRLP